MIEFTNRQLEILEILKKNQPITAEQIAEMLGVSKAALRSDLAVLVMTGYLEAKPKVGYFLGKSPQGNEDFSYVIRKIKVKDIQSIPVVIQETASVHDAVITLFLENVGSLIVVDKEGYLNGMVSRKDLLKVTLGNSSVEKMPVNLVMTRNPNIVTVTEEDSAIEAARKMIQNEVDSLPVVAASKPEITQVKQMVVGRVTKTHMTNLLLEAIVKR